MGRSLARKMLSDQERRRRRFLQLHASEPEPVTATPASSEENIKKMALELKAILAPYLQNQGPSTPAVDHEALASSIAKLVGEKLGDLSFADLNKIIHNHVNIPIENVPEMIDYVKKIEMALK